MSGRGLADAFAAIVGNFSAFVGCEADTAGGVPCRRPARWLLNLHGCERVTMCGQHLAAWERRANAVMGPWCVHCGRTWPTVADAYTVSAL